MEMMMLTMTLSGRHATCLVTRFTGEGFGSNPYPLFLLDAGLIFTTGVVLFVH